MKALSNHKKIPFGFSGRDIFDVLNSFHGPIALDGGSPNMNFPRCDIDESKNYVALSFDIPGLRKDDINIEVKEGQLIVSGTRKSDQERSEYSERFYGNFERRFTLSEYLDTDNIEASYENGVLEVLIPKTEVQTSKKIEISYGKKKDPNLAA